MQLRKEKSNLETQSKSRSRAATRPRDVGIPSNRTSSASGEYVPEPCTHRPSNHPSRVQVRFVLLDISNLGSVRRVKSSQGSCRGTCGSITSFFSFHKKKTFLLLFFASSECRCLFIITLGP